MKLTNEEKDIVKDFYKKKGIDAIDTRTGISIFAKAKPLGFWVEVHEIDIKKILEEEQTFNGIDMQFIVCEAEGINEFNSVRFWLDGKEVNPKKLKMVVYKNKD